MESENKHIYLNTAFSVKEIIKESEYYDDCDAHYENNAEHSNSFVVYTLYIKLAKGNQKRRNGMEILYILKDV